jgi:hypothetical protein
MKPFDVCHFFAKVWYMGSQITVSCCIGENAKCEVVCVHDMQTWDGWRCSSTRSEARHWLEGNGQFHAPAVLPRGKNAWCAFSRRLDGPRADLNILENRIKSFGDCRLCNKQWMSAKFRSSLLCYHMQPVLWAGQTFPGSCSPPLPVPINPPCPPPDILLNQLNYLSRNTPPLAWAVSMAKVGSGVPHYCNTVCSIFITLLWEESNCSPLSITSLL